MPYMVDSFEVFDGDNFSPITQLYGVLLHPIDYDSNNLDILPLSLRSYQIEFSSPI